MGNLTQITKFKHFSGLTISASKSLPNPTLNRYASCVERKTPKISLCINEKYTIFV